MMTRFIFFSALLIITQTLPVHGIRSHSEATSSVLSLSLHHRDSVANPETYNNLTARTKSRIEADAARVNYLNSRLRKALFKTDSGDFQTPVTVVGGAYVARIGVGQPATESIMVADTGSEIVWLKCSPCSQCSSDPIFNPSKSSSYGNLSCNAPKCIRSEGITCGYPDNCGFSASYGDGSTTSGDFATETLSFGSSGSAKNIAIGCAHEVGGNLDKFGGIIGLGPDPVSLPNQLESKLFSYCLSAGSESDSGTLDFNSAAPRDSVSVPIVRNPSKDIYYYVELSGITVGKDKVPVPPEVYRIGSDGSGGVIVDSGTTLTYLDSSVYTSFVDAFQKNAGNLVSAPVQEGSDACYTITGELQGPAMSFQFSNGESLDLAPENYFVRVDETTYCLAFQPTAQIVSIIGNVAQKGMRVTHDLGKNQISFSPNKC